ncbi:MAG: DbpA RNA binding domain-containing protein [Treponemataceae bacterium]|nr:DbpA RNA binding domain-containing protein [Treponemataceae bacterium]
MAFRRNGDLDMQKVAAFLKDAVAKVEASPESLEELKKVFKKNVPLTRRSYVAAYLLKQSAGAIFRFNARGMFDNARDDFRSRRDVSRPNRYESRTERVPYGERDHSDDLHDRVPHVQIDPSLATSVFVSIGRNRRVFPRDLVGLFCSVAGIERERIGEIKVLANYSFVQVYSEDAQKAIAALNGYDYRGRKLAVNLSRQKEEGAVSLPESEPRTEAASVPNSVENTSAPIADAFTTTNSDTMAEQAAFAKAQADLTDEEILAARAPRSSSSEDM